MKKILFLIPVFSVSFSFAQKANETLPSFSNCLYFSTNPLSIAELQSAAGAGIHIPFSSRTALFTELAAIFKSPFYKNWNDIKFGYRGITQLRFYSRVQKNSTYFFALEARIKHYSFNNTRTFINDISRDTLNNLSHTAIATSVGGGIVFGTRLPISKNQKWQIEFTAGIGGKQKFVRYKKISSQYKPVFIQGGFGLAPPQIDEPVGMPYFPIALRICYLIH